MIEVATRPPGEGTRGEPLALEGVRILRTRDVLTRILRQGALGAYLAGLVLSLSTRVLGELHLTLPGVLSLARPWLSYATAGLLAAAFLAATRRFQRGRIGGVEVGAGTLAVRLGGEREKVKAADFTGGLLLPAAEGHVVRLSRRGKDGLRITVPDARTGKDLLEALGLGPRGRTVEVELDAPNRALHVGLRTFFLMWLLSVLTVMALFAVTYPPMFQVWLQPAMVIAGVLWSVGPGLAMAWWWPQRVTLGADGLLWSRRGGHRFIRYASITGIQRSDERLTLSLRGGAKVTLRTTGAEAISTAEALEARMRATMEQNAARAGEPGYEVLDPADKDVGSWLRAIESRAQPAHAFREATFEPERLRAVLDDATTTGAKRLGAAVALASSGEADAPGRIRIAAQGTASPRLRVALEKIADGQRDEAAIQEVLAEEEPSARRAPPPGT